eukprot:COSAG03_NODE_949_length_5223_cov_6.034543_4_plen_232_part_00
MVARAGLNAAHMRQRARALSSTYYGRRFGATESCEHTSQLSCTRSRPTDGSSNGGPLSTLQRRRTALLPQRPYAHPRMTSRDAPRAARGPADGPTPEGAPARAGATASAAGPRARPPEGYYSCTRYIVHADVRAVWSWRSPPAWSRRAKSGNKCPVAPRASALVFIPPHTPRPHPQPLLFCASTATAAAAAAAEADAAADAEPTRLAGASSSRPDRRDRARAPTNLLQQAG